ncbi:MAG: redox-regulated ATPase YchF [Candidatus Moraniibacteriota bacterium]|nr:MAG: redox-regulated ATPase YchF [Candidatus Moranbacteria bacterium]
MSLSVGIVGLPNVGKSTLFNALLSKQQAFAANYPFATIEPNVGVVPVPDERLATLAPIVNTTKLVPATVTFLDIAGLVKGAAQGEGLGNKFLSHIREASVILHVVRSFADPNVVQTGSGDSVEDYLTIETELQLADLATVEKVKGTRSKVKDEKREAALEKIYTHLQDGKSVRQLDLTEDEQLIVDRELFLLTAKPILFALNTDEQAVSQKHSDTVTQFISKLREKGVVGVSEKDVVLICAKLEEELAGFDESEKKEYLESAGISRTGLETLIAAAYQRLGLQSFLTAGELEVRAWTINKETLAPDAAGVIHTDFVKHFISAKVCSYADFVEHKGWKGAAEKGKVRTEGKTYIMQEGDIVEFMIGK